MRGGGPESNPHPSPGGSPAPSGPGFPSILILSTYHGLADADAGLGNGLGGLVLKAFWERGGMAPFPGLQCELVSHFKRLSQRQDDLVG